MYSIAKKEVMRDKKDDEIKSKSWHFIFPWIGALSGGYIGAGISMSS